MDTIVSDYLDRFYEDAYEARLRRFFQKAGLSLDRRATRFDDEDDKSHRPLHREHIRAHVW
jgi:hypothetical protein